MTSTAAPAVQNPYVGLRPFRSDEMLLFFGRRRQISELMNRLHRSRFLAVVGSSGCGKSSLMRAGLIPRLEAGFLVESRDRWLQVSITPGERPLPRLAAAFGIAENELRERGAAAIVEHLEARPKSEDTNALLLIDQFEEIFRFALRGGAREDAADFVAILLALAAQRDFPVFVALTMRSDFLGDCEEFHGLPEAFNSGAYLVPRHTREQRKEAIEAPARLAACAVSPELVDCILNDVGDEPDRLPIMEHALLRTWEEWQREGATGELLPAHYWAVGGARDALSRDADSAMEGMTQVERDLTVRMFQALTDTDAGNRRIRRSARLSELALVTGRPAAEVLAVVERFRGGGRSFLTVQDDPGSGDSLIDISHESLIRQWPTLRTWADEEAESKRVYLDLVAAVAHRKALLHDSDLQVALEWRSRRQPTEAWARRYDPRFQQVVAYLDASEEEARREAREREARRLAELRAVRSRRIAAAFLSLALIAIAGFVWAFRAQRDATALRAAAERAAGAARQSATQAQTAAEAAETEKGLALQAAQREADQRKQADTARQEAVKQQEYAQQQAALADAAAKQANAAKAEALQQQQRAVRTSEQNIALAQKAQVATDEANKARLAEQQQREAAIRALALPSVQEAARASDVANKTVALAWLAHALRLDPSSALARRWIFDLLVRGGFRVPESRFTHPPVQTGSPVLHLAYSPDGKRFVTAAWNGTAQLWDSTTVRPVGRRMPHPKVVNFASFSPDGRLLATACADGAARIWNAQTGEAIGEPLPHAANLSSAVFSPNGKYLVTSSWDKTTAQLWNLETRQHESLPTGNGPLTFAGLISEDLLVAAPFTGSPKLIRLHGITLTLSHPGPIRAVSLNEAVRRVATASADGTARVWADDGRPIGDAVHHSKAVNAVDLDRTGALLATGSEDQTARVWDLAAHAPASSPLQHTGRVTSVAFTPSGKQLLTATYLGSVQIWDIDFDFDQIPVLADFAEAFGGYEEKSLPDLVPLPDHSQRLNRIRADVTAGRIGGTTGDFLRWFFSTQAP